MRASPSILTLLLFAIVNSSLSGQFNETYRTETIYLRLNTYVKNEQVYTIGFMGGNLRREMEISREAMVTYKRYQRQRMLGTILSGAGLVAEIAALSTNSTQMRDGLIIGGLACALISLPFSINADRNLNRAVWIRNGDVLRQ
ncbi:MAG TPA: hypothetical protein VI603_18035 [Saprospiraceae bacterium]|nr:hypothetical protein [Saprospiraceae bacterium]